MVHRHRPLIRKQKPSSGRRGVYRGLLTLIILLDVAIVLAHLWGRVQINFIVRRNEQLEEKKRKLQAEIDDLSAQINNMKSYQRIVKLAKEQGLVFVSTDQLEDLPVDLKNIRRPDSREQSGVAYAGLVLFKPKSKTPGFSEGTDVR
jgi:cell division protein FtsL